jgi:hypothetical protein
MLTLAERICYVIPTETLTGIGSNHWTCMFILIGSGNLYPALNDTVGGTCTDPNKLPKETSEHNLEASIIQSAPFATGFLGIF